MTVDVERVKQLLNDAAFLDKCSEAQSVEDIVDFFHNEGVELSCEQVEGLLSAAMASAESDELSEEMLLDVVGGASVKSTIKKCIDWFKKGWSWGSKFYDWEQNLYKKLGK